MVTPNRLYKVIGISIRIDNTTDIMLNFSIPALVPDRIIKNLMNPILIKDITG